MTVVNTPCFNDAPVRSAACDPHPDHVAAMTASGCVAVIGAGPSGLATARFLRGLGMTPVLFDQSDGVGGQWRVGAAHSSIWPGMHTNTSRVNTAFSDMPHPPGTAAYPPAEQIGA